MAQFLKRLRGPKSDRPGKVVIRVSAPIQLSLQTVQKS